MDDGMEEVLRRLEALERRVEELERDREPRSGDAHECPFRTDERRIVDLVVRLTAERVEEALARVLPERRHPHGPPDDHGGPPPGPPPPHGGYGGPPRRGR